MKSLALAALLMLAAPVGAQDAATAPSAKPTANVPVYPGDLPDQPYMVIGEVTAGIRKTTVFSKAATPEKIYRELWERAQKIGADAVIFASYGEAHAAFSSWGKTNATGKAIKFLPKP
jgi:hypothetical protein